MEASKSDKKKLRVVIVGAGYVAKHHIAALRKLSFVELVAICDLDVAAARAVANANGISVAVQSLSETAGLSPSVVYVLTPPASHAAIALEAMDMGCHVFVEKPMAESVADCDTMIEKARSKGLTLSVNHSDRFDPVVLKAIALARVGAIGEVISVDILRSSDYPAYGGGELPAQFRKGSYPFWDLGVHAIYTMESFLGAMQRLAVDYSATNRSSHLRFDEWAGQAKCEKGIGRVMLSWNARPMENRLVVRGTRGKIEVDRFLQVCRIYRVLPGPKFVGILFESWRNAVLDLVRIPWNVLRFATGVLKSSPGIRSSAIEFARSVHEGRAPPVDSSEGRRAVALLESVCGPPDAERSAELNARFAVLTPVDALVTGAGGFLGRELVRALRARGQRVRVLVRRPDAEFSKDDGIQVVIGDLGEPAIVDHAIKGAQIVYHVGAAMRGSATEFEAGTVCGTRNVISSCRTHRPDRVVYVSSMSVYDHAGRQGKQAITEGYSLEPHPHRRGAYTQTKLAAEHLVTEAIQAHGLPAVIIRPGQIIGPGAEQSTPNGVLGIAGRWIAVGSGRQTLPLVYRDDVVHALLLAAESPEAVGKVFNIVDTESCTQAQYLSRCKQFLGKKLRVVRVPTWAFLAASWIAEQVGWVLRREMPLTRYRVRSLRPLANFDLTAAHAQLGWQPLVGVSRGLDVTFGSTPSNKTSR